MASFGELSCLLGTNTVTNRNIRTHLNEEIKGIQAGKPFFKPSLVIIQVGDRPDSSTYVRMKLKAAVEANIECEIKNFPESITQVEVINCHFVFHTTCHLDFSLSGRIFSRETFFLFFERDSISVQWIELLGS